ncbi:MAG: glutamate-5-semialdehyde dehydrogenase, partial [Duodenibacillus sp.]|nr:glutamate-5-semialdehyde dehydrogenase [Duodenibacillus sp.]
MDAEHPDTARLMTECGERARAAARKIAAAGPAAKNLALTELARLLRARREDIFAVNAEDVAAARANGYPEAYVDRLTITEKVLETMALGCEQIAMLPDPVGAVSDMKPQACGILVGRMRVPLGVLGIIFESRPNVTVDAAALAVKSGNAAILRGGSEAFRTNALLGKLVGEALSAAGLPADAVQTAPVQSRDFVGAMITAPQYIDVIIPRGGKGLIARLERDSLVPMIDHLHGICHTYVDRAADLAMAVSVCDNAKTQRCSPCNAMETLLVHKDVASAFLPMLGRVWLEKGVEMRCDPTSKAILAAAGIPAADASPEDWDTEYN